MKPFTFALGPMLEVREREERSAAAAFAAALRGTALERTRAATLVAERACIGRALGTPRATPDAVRANFSRLESLAGEIARAERAVALASEREARAFDAYRIARREHRRLGLLRERALAAHRLECDAHDERFLEEANAARTSSTSRASSFHI